MNYGERLRRKVQEAKETRKPETTGEPDAETEATPERKAPTIAELNRQSRFRQTFK